MTFNNGNESINLCGRCITTFLSGCIIRYNFYESNPVLAYQIIMSCITYLVAPIPGVNKFSKKSGSHLKYLGTRMRTWSKFHTQHLTYTDTHTHTHTHKLRRCAIVWVPAVNTVTTAGWYKQTAVWGKTCLSRYCSPYLCKWQVFSRYETPRIF